MSIRSNHNCACRDQRFQLQRQIRSLRDREFSEKELERDRLRVDEEPFASRREILDVAVVKESAHNPLTMSVSRSMMPERE